jgi:hypothetical protein
MEQWMLDGRTAVGDRGRSLVPAIAEQLGFTADLTGGLRGIMKRVTRAGDASSGHPQQYAECTVHFQYRPSVELAADDAKAWEEAYLNTPVVDGSDESGVPLEVVAGAGQVAQGLDEALVTMNVGEVSDLWLDPAFAFRDNSLRTSRGLIPAGMPVLLRLELVSFENPLSPRSRIAVANDRHKSAGNERFRQGDFEGAMQHYARALKTLGSAIVCGSGLPPGERPALVERDRATRLAVLGNLSACAFQLGQLEKARQSIDRALKIDPFHTKSVLRKVAILKRLQDFGEARKSVQRALDRSSDAESKAALEMELAAIDADEAAHEAAASALFRRMI